MVRGVQEGLGGQVLTVGELDNRKFDWSAESLEGRRGSRERKRERQFRERNGWGSVEVGSGRETRKRVRLSHSNSDSAHPHPVLRPQHT